MADLEPRGVIIPTDTIAARYAHVKRMVRNAELASRRTLGSVRILLATKTVEPARIIEALDAGADLIGENRVQEVTAKYDALSGHRHESHFIGHLQRNKVNALLGKVDCLQSLDSIALAARLQNRLEAIGGELDVMIQVNVTGEESKNGIAPDQAPDLISAIADCPRLRLRGYMTIGLHSTDQTAIRTGYTRLRMLRGAMAARGLPGATDATELSMGMSGDYLIAIDEGATIVRLGSAVFGERPAP